MPKQSKTAELLANPAPGGEEGLPDWARSATAEPSTSGEAPIEGQISSATPALDNLLEWLVNEAKTDEESAMGMEAIVRQALAAPDVASTLRKIMPVSASQYVDVPILLLDFTIRESEFEGEGGLPFYASLDAMVGEPPEPRVINVGSISILAQLKRLRELNEWPLVVMVTEAAKAKPGRSAPLRLSQVDIT